MKSIQFYILKHNYAVTYVPTTVAKNDSNQKLLAGWKLSVQKNFTSGNDVLYSIVFIALINDK